MTPTQLDHLKRIDAHLERLIGIASKRTPGEWEQDHIYVDTSDKADLIKADGNVRNATFIASCAGNAEAGWKATRETIAWLDRMGAMMGLNSVEQKLADSILAAFPLETLK
jgi:hypothetical protein